ncbi:unnamed protein product [Thlaspi arvense]|uniref:Uncharacterized protein n=1 Tax=Thlaspi arvense TaxID=13288 RepID=A0AAU9RPV2_THLAR|nr:unnamed protein product [Thlaspi arvense]
MKTNLGVESFPRTAFLFAFCVAASVSKTFGSTIESDSVGEKFLPPEYSSPNHPFSSTKNLYSAICDDYVLIEDGKMSLCLDKANGMRSIMLSGKELDLSWGENPHFWQWISIPESRFDKVLELILGCPFKIHGSMKTRFLSPGTRYSAYVVYKTKYRIYDIQKSIGVGWIEYQTREGEKWERQELTKVVEREDGWMEVNFGEFFNQEGLMDDDEIVFHITEIKYSYWKPGFIIQGIDFRPVKKLWQS